MSERDTWILCDKKTKLSVMLGKFPESNPDELARDAWELAQENGFEEYYLKTAWELRNEE